ncbi:hypothetical protein ACRAWD_10390 [Caulobacter segnis]
MKAQAAALGLPTVTGQTTLSGEKPGATEAWMLSSSAIKRSGLARSPRTSKARSRSLLLAKDCEVVNLFTLADSLKGHIDTLSTAAGPRPGKPTASRAARQTIGSPSLEGAEDLKGLGAAPAVIGAVLGAFKVDTDIQGVVVDPGDTAFVNAVANKLDAGTAILPSEILGMPAGGTKPASDTVMGFWNKLAESQRALSDCRTRLAGKAETDTLKARDRRDRPSADADRHLRQRRDRLQHRCAQPARPRPPGRGDPGQRQGAAGPRRARRRQPDQAHHRPDRLRLSRHRPDQRPGRQLPADRSRTGKVLKSDLLVCRTAATRLGKVQEGKVGVAGCGQTTLAAQQGSARPLEPQQPRPPARRRHASRPESSGHARTRPPDQHLPAETPSRP